MPCIPVLQHPLLFQSWDLSIQLSQDNSHLLQLSQFNNQVNASIYSVRNTNWPWQVSHVPSFIFLEFSRCKGDLLHSEQVSSQIISNHHHKEAGVQLL